VVNALAGINGDYYLNTATYDLFQKVAGVWTLVCNLKGATGEQGPQGDQGEQGEAGVAGSQILCGASDPT
jgi:hypothetical protein